MERNETVIDVAPEVVWSTLADGSSFDKWVVGCKEIRAVEGDWPTVGSSIHHTVGVGPATIDDTTTVEAAEPPRRLVLRARARPVGVARVELILEPTADGRTQVTMVEGVIDGPASKIPDAVTDPLLKSRNTETLDRLKDLAEQRGGVAT